MPESATAPPLDSLLATKLFIRRGTVLHGMIVMARVRQARGDFEGAFEGDSSGLAGRGRPLPGVAWEDGRGSG